MPTRPPQHRPPFWKPAPPAPKRPDPSHQRLHTKEWHALRAKVLKRDDYQCTWAACTTPARGRGGRLICDHIVAAKDGGPDTMENCRTLCPACDNRRHAEKGRQPRS